MDDALFYHRLQFAFTITFHYIFPQITIGLSAFIVFFKYKALKTGDKFWEDVSLLWGKILGLSFLMGVVTGIPMEFQFGTNWSRFSEVAGNIIGQTLALEGMFSFILESSFIGLFLYGKDKLSPKLHFLSSVLVFLGSWLSGYFIVVTNGFMQNPIGYKLLENGQFALENYSSLFTNPWAFWQYLHTMVGAVVTCSALVAGVGAYYLLTNKYINEGKEFIKFAVKVGLVASFVSAFPTGDKQAKNVLDKQPATFAAMEGIFHTEKGAPIILIGQPDMKKLKIDNPIYVPNILSFITYKHFNAEVKGLTDFPREDWPTNVPLLYYAYHIMVGLGTIFMVIFGVSVFQLKRKKLFDSKPILWALTIMTPFPFIANIAGWYTAELGRQPWLIYGVMKTINGTSLNVSSGNALFTLLGFMGIYFFLGLVFVFLFFKIITFKETLEVH